MQGLISEDKVKDCVSRLFMVKMKLGEFDPIEMNPYKKYVMSVKITKVACICDGYGNNNNI